jgi:hypothetical protein
MTKCKKCGYEWESKSKCIYVSCPSCCQKVKKGETKEKKTKLKFFCYGKLLKEYPLRGFDKGEVPEILKNLSKVNNVPETNIQIIID